MTPTIRFIDLFAGIGGIGKGFEQACDDLDLSSRCVFVSEIKPHAVEILRQNRPNETVAGDITRIPARDIPDFDVLLAGFPCQAFSSAGKRLGFEDTRGTLFFEVARILREKQPSGFVLENVEGLVNHDKARPGDAVGQTLTVILRTLKDLGYRVAWKVLNAKHFGVAQDRKRVYIVGARERTPDLNDFAPVSCTLKTVLEHGLPCVDSPFVRLLLRHYSPQELYGKSIKDKRGGADNIHSWDIALKGEVSEDEKNLLNAMLKERRKKKWATEYGIDWMDGMPLTREQTASFFPAANLDELLADLTRKGYLKKEHPKKKVGNARVQDPTLPMGYNIVSGKMSFEINKILDPDELAPTLVAMDMRRLFVVDGEGLRPLSAREGLRLFGYPDDFRFETSRAHACDLLGNTVAVPVIRAISKRLLTVIVKDKYEINVRTNLSQAYA